MSNAKCSVPPMMYRCSLEDGQDWPKHVAAHFNTVLR